MTQDKLANLRRTRHAVFASDIRCLGGVVTVVADRDRSECQTMFRVSHVSRGGDIAFRSGPIHDADQADAAARVLAEFTGAALHP